MGLQKRGTMGTGIIMSHQSKVLLVSFYHFDNTSVVSALLDGS